MNRKAKSILKIVVPVANKVPLAAIIVLLSKDKAFNCRLYDKGAIACRQIKL